MDILYEQCKDCKYFREHYVKSDYRFMTLHEGHCINRELNPDYKRKKYLLIENCGHWESNEDVKAERRENMKNVIRDIRTSLINVENILNDDL